MSILIQFTIGINLRENQNTNNLMVIPGPSPQMLIHARSPGSEDREHAQHKRYGGDYKADGG
jgi:hypothetical protein